MQNYYAINNLKKGSFCMLNKEKQLRLRLIQKNALSAVLALIFATLI